MPGRTAGIILVGDEILKGQVKDTNSHFMCKRFRAVGTKVLKISVVEDVVEEIARTVKEFSDSFDIVVTSGGIGPTHDDVTYAGVAAAFNDDIVCNDALLVHWNKIINSSLNESARALSCVPRSAELIWVNTESVLEIDSEGRNVKTFPVVKARNVFVFPGVPQYLEPLFVAMEKEHFHSLGRSFYTGRIYLSVHEELLLKALNRSVEECKDCVFGSYPVVNNDKYKTQITVEAETVGQVKAAEDHFTAQVPPQWVVATADNMSNPVFKFLHTTADSQLAALLQNSIKVVERGLELYPRESLMLSFNGGKDCTVLLHIILAVCQQQAVPEPLQTVYFRPAKPFPEIEQFIADTVSRYQLQLTTLAGPIKPALEVLAQQKPNVQAIFLGTRRTDPFSSDLNDFQMTDPDWTQLMRINPILDWSYRDVWTFLRGIAAPYCSLYNQGYTSLGNQDNTKPNPSLRVHESDGTDSYRPAWMLTNDSGERHGRLQQGVGGNQGAAGK